MKKIAEEIGLIFFSSPFDKTAVDFLENINVPAYKIASFEITDIPLIEYVASKGKPVIISTGIATLEDINEAIEACKRKGNRQIALLKCTSAYPAPLEELNLSVIPDMKKRFGTIIGLSDHTTGTIIPSVACGLGAKIIEKHFILDRKLGGPDSEFSLEPAEFSEMISAVRNVERAMGKPVYELSRTTLKSREFSRSLFVVEDVEEGEAFDENNVRSIRPSNGLAPKYLNDVLGKRAKSKIKKGTPLSWELICG